MYRQAKRYLTHHMWIHFLTYTFNDKYFLISTCRLIIPLESCTMTDESCFSRTANWLNAIKVSILFYMNSLVFWITGIFSTEKLGFPQYNIVASWVFHVLCTHNKYLYTSMTKFINMKESLNKRKKVIYFDIGCFKNHAWMFP